MEAMLLQHLRAQSATIHVRWETLLRLEPVSGPLANPDALVRLIPESLARVLEDLSQPPNRPLSHATLRRERLPACDCAHNPYLAYFIAGERAFVEAMVLIQATLPPTDRCESDLVEVIRAVRHLGRDEIDTFCEICTLRGNPEKCPRAVAPAAMAK